MGFGIEKREKKLTSRPFRYIYIAGSESREAKTGARAPGRQGSPRGSPSAAAARPARPAASRRRGSGGAPGARRPARARRASLRTRSSTAPPPAAARRRIPRARAGTSASRPAHATVSISTWAVVTFPASPILVTRP